MSLLRPGATVQEKIRYWYNYARVTARVWAIGYLGPVVSFFREILVHGITLFTITTRHRKLQDEFNKLAMVYSILAEQTRDIAQMANETRLQNIELQRRIKWYERGPLAVSRVALEKRDGEARRKKIIVENGAKDTTPSIPLTEDIGG